MVHLVAGFPGDTELSAKSRHPLAIEKPGHEPETFIHLATLLPRHFALPRKGPKVLPMCPESGVTLLSGRAYGPFRTHR
jgi:hypothetical protein